MPYHITKGGHNVPILGYQPRKPLDEELADKMNVDETDPAKKYIRYEKANKKIDSLISHIEGKVDVILLLGIPEELTATVEAELLQLYDRLFTIAGDERLRNELRKQRDVLAVKEWMQRKGIII